MCDDLPNIPDTFGQRLQLVSSQCKDLDNCRSLTSVVVTCITTLVACTWVSVHPNVPGPYHGKIRAALHRLKLMALAIVAPEVIVIWALRQRMVARQLTTQHLNMTMTHGFFVSMGGFVIAREHVLKPIASHNVGTEVDVDDIVAIAEEEIFDHSKGDEITKGFAMLQTAWFILQCIARRAQSLPLTELELMTVAFSSINLIIYITWWEKPLDVRRAIRIGPPPLPDPSNYVLNAGLNALQKLQARRNKTPLTPRMIGNVLWRAIDQASIVAVRMFSGEQAPFDDILDTDTSVPTLWAGRLDGHSRAKAAVFAVFVAIGFGAIHLGAWGSFFPTRTEQIMWRAASVAVVSIPFILFLDTAFIILFQPPNWYRDTTYLLLVPLAITTYVAARAFLVVLSFMSLRLLPPDAYKDISWTEFIPHIN